MSIPRETLSFDAPTLANKENHENSQHDTVKMFIYHASQQFLVGVQVDNSLPHDIISAVMYCMHSLGKCGIFGWLWECALLWTVRAFLLLRQTGLCLHVCPNVLDYKQVTQHTRPIGGSEGRQRGMGEAA